MKSFAIRTTVALLSFLAGLCCDALPRLLHTKEAARPAVTFDGEPGTSASQPSPPQVALAQLEPEPAPALLDQMCAGGDSLEYRGYKVSKEYDSRADRWKIIIKKGGQVVAVNRDGDGRRESSCFGLYPVLGGRAQQLMTAQTSGGMHCCYSYRIYDLSPAFRLLFDGDTYPIGDGFDELEFVDLDGDGVQEFTQRDMTFDYWDGMGYPSSPQPKIVFQYDPQAKKFYPANKKFSAYLLKDVDDDIKALDSDDPAQYWVSGLEITLRYIYAGKERKGWKLYDRTFGVKLYEKDRMKTKLKRTLMSDRVYRFLYGR